MKYTRDALEKLCKWRSVLAGWHHGTKSMTAPGTKAMRDLMDKWLVMRCESSALAELLVEKGVFSAEEFANQVYKEAALLDKQMERLFPGFRTSMDGPVIFDVQIAQETMRQKGFPP
jgi:hypothetical protein